MAEGSLVGTQSSTMSNKNENDTDFSVLPPIIHAIIHENFQALDADSDRFLKVLLDSSAVEIWHKHGHFYSHLHDVWKILVNWKQPQAICRLGLFHSAYSNSYISMNLYNPDTDAGRTELRDVVGQEAEELIWKFCVINRREMENYILAKFLNSEDLKNSDGDGLGQYIPINGKVFKHIRTGESVFCTAKEIRAFVIETIADYHDQSFGWQSDMEGSNGATRFPNALWPGIFKPTLRMSKISKFSKAVRVITEELSRQDNNGNEFDIALPPIFNHCQEVLCPINERKARDLYWKVISQDPNIDTHDTNDNNSNSYSNNSSNDNEMTSPNSNKYSRADALEDLVLAAKLNPYVAEIHTVRCQLLMQESRWEEAADAAKCALQLFYDWATQWDNRMPFVAWVSWTRCMLLQASFKEWPETHGGIESLGAVHPSQRFRKLNINREEL